MSVAKGNCLPAQSGGPTAVINASVAGAAEEAMKHPEISGVYAALNGIRGQVDVEVGGDGLPVYVRLEKQMLDKKTAAYTLK